MTTKSNPRQILEKVNKLDFADISCYELLSFGTEACFAIMGQETNEENTRLKARIMQIREYQLKPLLDEELLVEERAVMFSHAKENLSQFLSDYLASEEIPFGN
jgi:hypothetical protein